MRAGSRVAAGLALAAAFVLPAAAEGPSRTYAQELADRTVAATPGLLAMQVTSPKMKDGMIVASRDAASSGADRFELELHDVVGEKIGTLGLTLARENVTDRIALENRAAGIRDALARRILNASNLLDPYPFEPGAATKTRAQKLVDELQASNPDLLVLALRAPPRGARDMVVLGSTFGRHGKKADADDLKVLESPEPRTGIYAGGKRFGADLQLRDGAGKPIGTLNVGYAFRQGDDEKALLRKAERLRDDLASRIPSVDRLDELDP